MPRPEKPSVYCSVYNSRRRFSRPKLCARKTLDLNGLRRTPFRQLEYNQLTTYYHKLLSPFLFVLAELFSTSKNCSDYMENAEQIHRPKAIALISGGLDSLLAAKLVQDQGVEVIGLHLLSPFGCREEVERVAASIGMKLLVKEKGEAYLDLVESPRYGYGRNMNPCVDCRIFMFQLADVVRQEEGADFIVTGEVLGQRPMSQQRHAMNLIDKNSPEDARVLRPLSAKLFEPSYAEQMGWVKREALLRLNGRSRKEQIALAEKWGLKYFSNPAGGCLLTDAQFSRRLKDFFAHKAYSSSEERLSQSQMLRLGRHFRFSDESKAIVARNDAENKQLRNLWEKTSGIFFAPKNFEGPVAVFFGTVSEDSKKQVGRLIGRYGKSKLLEEFEIEMEETGGVSTFQVQSRTTDEELEMYRL